jgi:hypothetical protein
MRASPNLIASLPILILLHSLSCQTCTGKDGWEFGRRVQSSNKGHLAAATIKNIKQQKIQLTTDTAENRNKINPSVSRRARQKGNGSSTARLEQSKIARDKKLIFFAIDLEDGSRERHLHSSYSYSVSNGIQAKAKMPQLEKVIPIEEKLHNFEPLSGPNVTGGLVPATSDKEQNFTESFISGDIPNTKVTCPLSEMNTPVSSIQRVTIRFTYEVDTNSTSFLVADIESLMFQSVVETLLNCDEARRELVYTRGRRKLQENGPDKSLQFIAIDSMPGDSLRANGEKQFNVSSTCALIHI